MQGQRSAIGSLPDSINFDYDSPSTNVGIDQQICWNSHRNPAENRLPECRISGNSSDNTYMGIVSQEGQNLGRWNVGESSSGNPPSLASHEERAAQSGWPPSTNVSTGTGLRLEEQRFEPRNLFSPINVNLNLNSNQNVSGPGFTRGSNSIPASQNIDINEGHFLRAVDDMDCPNSSKPLGFESRFNPSASGAADPYASSRSSGFLLDDDDGRPGCSLDGRRLSCKRKTLEGNAGQSSGSGSCFSRPEVSMWQPIAPHYDTGSSMNAVTAPESSPSDVSLEAPNPRLGLGVGGGVPVDNNRPLNVSSGPESSQRSFRLRMNPSVQPDGMPNSSFMPLPTAGTGHPDITPVHQPLRFVPINPPLDLMSPIPPDSSVLQNQSVILRLPSLRRNMQSHRWNHIRPGSSSGSGVSGERNTTFLDGPTAGNLPRNIGEHPLFVPPVEPMNSANTTNWRLSSDNVGIARNVGSSSRSGSASGSHSSPGHSWVPSRHPPSQYSRRLSEYVRRSLLSTAGSETVGQSNNNSQHRSAAELAASSQDVIPPIGGHQGHSHSRSRSALWIERQGEGAVGIPYLRALAAAGEGRSRLVSEIRNALDTMRRGEGLRFEDVMILEQSVFFGMSDIHDQHRDMRLDVDNMSYEELLALEERIGYVCTGLSEEAILKLMKQRKHVYTMSDDQTEAEPCCVCQEEYMDGEDLGTLDCGHDFHTECIKQWLAQKNLCPICKTTGLAT